MVEFNTDIWEKKYKFIGEASPEDSFKRVARAIATNPKEEEIFLEEMLSGRFMCGGRILAYAGTNNPKATLANCYVMGEIEDSMEGIMDSLKDSALTLKAGGGIGLNFSTIRPQGDIVSGIMSIASGAVSFMEMWNAMSRTISGVNKRKGAMIAVLNVDHPEIEKFISAKLNNTPDRPVLEKFNISVGITDEFMNAVINKKKFNLVFNGNVYKEIDAVEIMDKIVENAWKKAEPGVVYVDTINKMNNLYYCEKITATNPCVTGDTRILTSKGYVPIKETVGKKVEIWNGYEWSEVVPFSTGINDILNIEFSNGVTLKCTPYHKFILPDGTRVEAKDLNIGDKLKKYKIPVIVNGKEYPNIDAGKSIYVTKITKGEPEETFCFTEPKNHTGTFEGIVTGQCGEIPLNPNGACILGAINLTQFIKNPFEDDACFDFDLMERTIKNAVKFLDNTIDVCFFPLEAQREVALSRRRVGLGVMGLGSAFAMLNIVYGSEASIKLTNDLFTFIRDNAYNASIEIAKDKGAFPLFDVEKYLAGKFIDTLPAYIKKKIEKYGIRNSHLLTIAPTGSISQLVDYVSSGVEPIFCLQYIRKNPEYNQEIIVQDYAWKLYKKLKNKDVVDDESKPDFFVTTHDLTWKQHIDIMATCQKYIDNAISKTINLPNNISKQELKDVYVYAWKLGLKGCTIYREGSIEEILKKADTKPKIQSVKSSREYIRPYVLPGYTYKVKVPDSRHAYYLSFTYNPETGRPMEMFITTKDHMVLEWTNALGRVISAIFRNAENPSFIIEDLKDVMGRSGFFSPHRRKYVPSLIAEFGEVVRDFFIQIGLIEEEVKDKAINGAKTQFAYCNHCGTFSGIYEEGCFKCLNCGFNRCG